MDTLDLLLHPVRLRLMYAMSGGRTRTTSELCASLTDVPKTTVYRHVGLLAEAGVLEVESEHRVHGAVERRYRLHRARSVVDQDTAAAMSLDEHRNGFAAATAVLLAEFNAYLDRRHADPTADSVSYRQYPLWLSPDERAELIGDMYGLIMAKAGNEPTPERGPHLLSTVLFPTGEPPRSGPADADTAGADAAGSDAARTEGPGGEGAG